MPFKTPSFWYTPRGIASRVLTPLGGIYAAAGTLRRAVAKPYHAKVPVICIGNIVAGGAGKTPTALAIARILLDQGAKPVFVSRGYGGREDGPLRVDALRHTAQDVGDEPLLLARLAPVWIGRDRAAAVREAEKEASHIILDDGLQNPSVHKDVSFLVVDGITGFGNSALIPAGPLREKPESALKRVTAVIVIGGDFAPVTNKPIIRATLRPTLPANFPKAEKFVAFAGIGRPAKFYATCREAELDLAATQDFADHHAYTPQDLNRLEKLALHHGARLLTTEKDWVRLPKDFQKQVIPLPVTLVFQGEIALFLPPDDAKNNIPSCRLR